MDEKPIFSGFVFKKKRNKNGLISVTAYDQLRYFKNKDTYIYKNMTASELLKTLAADFGLFIGDVEDTKYIIPQCIEENKTLFDIMQNALEFTLVNSKEIYVLYDNFGKLELKNIGNMKVDFKIDADNAEDFDYESSIDGETYNKVKLIYKDDRNIMEVFSEKDDKNIKCWGVLQYFDEIDNRNIAAEMAKGILELYNNKSRLLSIKSVFGDIRVRAGCQVPVFLNLGDLIVNNYLIIEKCTHVFSHNKHIMDLELKGGEYV